MILTNENKPDLERGRQPRDILSVDSGLTNHGIHLAIFMKYFDI